MTSYEAVTDNEMKANKLLRLKQIEEMEQRLLKEQSLLKSRLDSRADPSSLKFELEKERVANDGVSQSIFFAAPLFA